MAESPDSELDKRRRDLYAISLAILVYLLAGGKLASQMPTPFGAMTLARPWVVEVGALFAWAYFLLRYHLHCDSPVAWFQKDLSKVANSSPFYRSIARREAGALLQRLELFAGLTPNDVERYGLNPHQNIRQEIANALISVRSSVAGGCYPMPTANGFLGAIDFSGMHWGKDAGACNLPQSMACVWQMPWLYSLRSVIEAAPVAIVKRAAFTDKLLPLLVGYSVPIAVVIAATM